MNLKWGFPIALLAFAGLSIPSHADAFKPSKVQQVQLGKRAAAELRRTQKILPSNDPRVQMLRTIGSRLLSSVKTNGDPWEFSFDVVESKDVNAFALPGGSVFFYTGLFDNLKTEDELAGVLGHEMTHVLKEHWAYAYADSQKRNLFLSLALVFAHANNNISNLASIGNEVVFDLPFSRKHETQADEGGLKMMVDAGYNPQGMVDVFTLLRTLSKGGSPPAFLSDHPDDKGRIQHMQDLIAQMPQNFPEMRTLPWATLGPGPDGNYYQKGYSGGG